MHGVASVTNDFTLPACTERVARRFRRLGIGVSASCENLRNLRILRLEPAFNWRKVRFLLFKGYDFCTSASKRGSPRRGSSFGSTLIMVMVRLS